MTSAVVPRVALFTDSFHEVNGVALTSRMLEEFAHSRGYPMLSVHTGPDSAVIERDSVTRCELAMSPFSFGLEKDLRFDLAFLRHYRRVNRAMQQFRPELVHFTGPSHLGILGALLAWRMKLPVVASWHTNIHEYAGRRLGHVLSWLPDSSSRSLQHWAERQSLEAAARYYKLARVTLAPNPELVQMLEQRTGRPSHIMRRGVDTVAYHPGRRQRTDEALVVGYVGRLSPEKSVRQLAAVELELERAGLSDFRIEIAGHGSEREWLAAHVRHLRDHGVLLGEPLARVYAGFDIFAFPSETDTYGNVVQEAMASGVPCVVTASGGPASIVTHGSDGFVCATREEFAARIVQLALDAGLRRQMGERARRTALDTSWDRVFEGVYDAYRLAVGSRPRAAAPL